MRTTLGFAALMLLLPCTGEGTDAEQQPDRTWGANQPNCIR